jgi:hypothetical protein
MTTERNQSKAKELISTAETDCTCDAKEYQSIGRCCDNDRDFVYHKILVILLPVMGPAMEEGGDEGDYNTWQCTVDRCLN